MSIMMAPVDLVMVKEAPEMVTWEAAQAMRSLAMLVS